MPDMTPEMFAAVLPKAIQWAEDYQKFILQSGEELSQAERADAQLVGVRRAEEVRILYVPHIPRPDDGLLKTANEIIRLVTPDTVGLTLSHGILIRIDFKGDRRLLVHELVHTSQYERFGSIEAFLRRYLEECISVGYPHAPLEQEAVLATRRICQ